jgi:serine/threonine protein kinase
MGEVYRARDTRLGRDVAVKVLPDQLATSPGGRERLEREARAVSRLSHPSICTLHDVGEHEDRQFIVMEYLEGETLGQRLRRGALPMADVSRIGADLADALAHAHRHGVLHLDVKPANIMLVTGGVKLLDFGLVRMDEAPGTPSATESLSAEGVIEGTVQYMAPERLEGRRVDGRADIFALGAVLYEMATGRPAFEGTSKAGIIAAILDRPVSRVSDVRTSTTDGGSRPLLDDIIASCLAKDPDERWQSANDLSQALKWAEASPPRAGRPQARRRAPPASRWIGWTALAMVSLAAVALLRSRDGEPDPARPSRWEVKAPPGSAFDPSAYSLAMSPDGSHLAFIASADGDNALWVRPLESLAARKLADGAAQPFWSANSRALAFDGGGQLKTVDLATGLVETLAETFVVSGSWNRTDTLIIALPGGERRRPGGLHAVAPPAGPSFRPRPSIRGEARSVTPIPSSCLTAAPSFFRREARIPDTRA